VGDGLASVVEWQRLVREHDGLNSELKGETAHFPLVITYSHLLAKYINLMNENPTSSTISGTTLSPTELSALVATGFLTTSMGADTRSSLFASPGAGSLSSLSSAGSRHAAGSLAAVGGAEAARHIPGGGSLQRAVPFAQYNFSLPNTGSQLKLLVEARTYFLSLLKKSKHKEVPMDVLRERWDGGVPTSDEGTRAKRARGEFTGVLPGRTKKWRQFWGLRFEWILEECVGAGLVECFETGSVGVGVRAT
jgi:hypothetical protein